MEISHFKINLNQVTGMYTIFESMEAELKVYKENVDQIRYNLNISGAGTYDLKQQLKTISEDIEEEERAVYRLKEVLEESVRKYGMTEAKLSRSTNVLKYLGDYLLDFVDDIGDGFIQKLDTWKRRHEEWKASMYGKIDDTHTATGFTKAYMECLEKIYDDVPREYEDAKYLYEKHLKNLVVGEFQSVDENGNASAYHSSGKLFINTNSDLSNARGNGTTFYHEYGHYIVYQEGWIEGEQESAEFSKFDELLRKEISSYVNTIEEQHRTQGMEQGYTDLQLEKYIERETIASLKTDICGANNEYMDINNGISDIIDGVTNGKYQPGYGHGDGYWEANQTRTANEAFAQIYSAQMTSDEVELSKMKELMPDTYAYYMKMIQNAAN